MIQSIYLQVQIRNRLWIKKNKNDENRSIWLSRELIRNDYFPWWKPRLVRRQSRAILDKHPRGFSESADESAVDRY